MANILLIISPFFIIIAIGSILRLFIANDKWVEVLNKFGYYIGFPAIVLTSFFTISSDFHITVNLIIYNVVILISIIVLTLVITRLLKVDNKIGNTYIVSAFFGNIAYLGFPFITTLLPGSESIVSVHIAIYLILVFTIGVFILEISNGWGIKSLNRMVINIIKNPLLISVAIGIIISVFKIKVPVIIRNPIQLIASAATPVVLLALGIFIVRKIELNKVFLHSVLITVIKLILVPAIFYFVLKSSITEKEFNISILESAMPLALTPFALAEIYSLDKQIIAVTIFLSTAISIVTLTVLTNFLKL